ncbi:carbonic anhydrase [Fretibacter rubidus]|uniref:carbonic anhydrase n=1 Tax=Fretibacter rubidus TaxID=570162 RepID=UPI003529E48F
MPFWTSKLVEGYQAFRAGDYAAQKSLYENLGKEGQAPKVMIIACADSRVDPTDIFHAYPGEMFVARNVANIVPPLDETDGFHGTSAAIEYAVNVLKVETIVVMGHESCGGIQGCLDGAGDDPSGGYVAKWVSLINGVRDRILAKNYPEDQITLQMELEVVRQSIANLMTFPFVKAAVDAGGLSLKGAYFSIIQARLMMLGDDGDFYLVPDMSAG